MSGWLKCLEKPHQAFRLSVSHHNGQVEAKGMASHLGFILFFGMLAAFPLNTNVPPRACGRTLTPSSSFHMAEDSILVQVSGGIETTYV